MAKQLTENQIKLVECLKSLKVEQDLVTAILLMIPTDEQIAKLAEYLLENPKACENEIVRAAVEISVGER